MIQSESKPFTQTVNNIIQRIIHRFRLLPTLIFKPTLIHGNTFNTMILGSSFDDARVIPVIIQCYRVFIVNHLDPIPKSFFKLNHIIHDLIPEKQKVGETSIPSTLSFIVARKISKTVIL